MNNYNTPIRYGLLAGTIMVAFLLILYIISAERLASFLPMLAYLPLIFLMIWGGITYRKELGNYKNFGHAFIAVLIISLIATFLFDTFGYLLYKVIDPDLPELVKKKAIENASAMMEKFGTPDDKVEEAIKRMQEQDYTPTLKSQLIRYGTSLLVGSLFSALIALFVNRPDPTIPPKVEA